MKKESRIFVCVDSMKKGEGRKMMIVFFLLIGLCSSTVYGIPYSTNRLAILADESEGGWDRLMRGAVTDKMNVLFAEQSSPVFMPTALWDKFFALLEIAKDVSSLSQNELDTKYVLLKKILDENNFGFTFEKYIENLKLAVQSVNNYNNNKIQEAKEASAKLRAVITSPQDPLYKWIQANIGVLPINFNSEDWYYYRPSDRFVLLVPKQYAQKLGDKLGLRIEKATPKELTDHALVWARHENRLKNEPKESLGTALLKDIEKIFVTPIDFQQYWAIYLNGHGIPPGSDLKLTKEIEDKRRVIMGEIQQLQMDIERSVGDAEQKKLKVAQEQKKDELNRLLIQGESEATKIGTNIPSVAGFSVDEFKQLLNYFSVKLPVSVFAYLTCYGGGSNLYQVYAKEQKDNFLEKHPFVSCTAGFYEGMTGSAGNVWAPPYENDAIAKYYKHSNYLQLVTGYYNTFFQEVEKSDQPINWNKALDAVFQFSEYQENIPLIKFPGTEWVTMLDLKNVLSIGKVKAATRDKPLKVLPEQQIILLYAQTIPFPMVYSENATHNFVSMVPGKAIHRLQAIEAKISSMANIINSFFFYHAQLQQQKTFFIKKIIARNDIFRNNADSVIELSNVFCISFAGYVFMLKSFFPDIEMYSTFNKFSHFNIVYFTYEGKAYGWRWPYGGNQPDFAVKEPEEVVLSSVEMLQKYLEGLSTEEGFSPSSREELERVLEKTHREEMKKKIEGMGKELKITGTVFQPQARLKRSKKSKALRVA
jgi:hypothetical protein